MSTRPPTVRAHGLGALNVLALAGATIVCAASCLSTEGYYRYRDGGQPAGTAGTTGVAGSVGHGGASGAAGTGGTSPSGIAGSSGTAGHAGAGAAGTTG